MCVNINNVCGASEVNVLNTGNLLYFGKSGLFILFNPFLRLNIETS